MRERVIHLCGIERWTFEGEKDRPFSHTGEVVLLVKQVDVALAKVMDREL